MADATLVEQLESLARDRRSCEGIDHDVTAILERGGGQLAELVALPLLAATASFADRPRDYSTFTPLSAQVEIASCRCAPLSLPIARLALPVSPILHAARAIIAAASAECLAA